MAEIDPGPLPELAWLPIGRLGVDPRYQRTLDSPRSQKHIAAIADNFRWSRFQAILATKSGEDWLVIDGQHRVEAAKRIGAKHVPAVVVAGATLAEQASAFVYANRQRVPVSAQALFYARLAAEDPAAAVVKRLADEADIRLLRYPLAAAKTPAGQTSSIPALLEAVRVYGEAHAADAMAALVECYGRIPGALRGDFFLVAARYLAERGDPAALRRALNQLGPDRLGKVPHSRGGHAGSPELLAVLRSTNTGGAGPGAVASGLPQRAVEPSRPASSPVKIARSGGGEVSKPAAPTGGASPPRAVPSRSASDQEAIDRFIAERGVTKLPTAYVAPSQQGALSEKDAAPRIAAMDITRDPTLPEIINYLKQNGRQAWTNGNQFKVAGEVCSKNDLYKAANRLRIAAGLTPYRVPSALASVG